MTKYGTEYAKHWSLDPEIIFLNHGSFGACPTCILEKQSYYRSMLEREPLRFFLRQFEDLYYEALNKLARFINADVENIAFVPNVTYAANSILRSLNFSEGDELLIPNQGYGAFKNILNFVAERTGARVVIAQVDFPVASPEAIVDSIVRSVTPRTRLAIIDHITSPTGLLFPVEQIIQKLAGLGIDTFIDGAHAPGAVPLHIESLGAAYYTGNCHKWLCAPKGSAFIYARPDRRELVHPAQISHPYVAHPSNTHSQFHSEFYWTGTNDFSAYLCVPDAIKFLGGLLPGSWNELMERNHNLAVQARALLCKALNTEPPCPDTMITTMCSLPLPDGMELGPFPHYYIDPLQNQLFSEYHIEVPVVSYPNPPHRLIRTSTHIYNSIQQYEFLCFALKESRTRY